MLDHQQAKYAPSPTHTHTHTRTNSYIPRGTYNFLQQPLILLYISPYLRLFRGYWVHCSSVSHITIESSIKHQLPTAIYRAIKYDMTIGPYMAHITGEGFPPFAWEFKYTVSHAPQLQNFAFLRFSWCHQDMETLSELLTHSGGESTSQSQIPLKEGQ